MKPDAAKPPKHSFFLHCDECHFEVDFEEKMTRKHIGYRCPMCQADMLTEADYKVGARMQFVAGVFRFLGLMRPARRGETGKEGEVLLRHHVHNGKLTVTEKKLG
jgi:hypothetical protein